MIERNRSTLEREVAPGSSMFVSRLPHAVWGAIFAGVVMVIVTQLTLALLGGGIGLSAVDPGEGGELKAIGIGAIAWWIISGLVAFYFGGWTAGRMAGIPRTIDGVMHGLLTWGVTTLITLFFLTSAIGAIIGGGFSLLKSGGKAVSQAAPQIAQAAPQISGAIGGALPVENIPGGDNMQAIQGEIRQLLQERGAGNVQQAETQLMAALGVLATLPPENQEDQKQAIANTLSQNANIAPAEARPIVDRWAVSLQGARQEVQQGAQQAGQQVQQAGQQVKETAEQGASTAGKGVLASFAMVFLGAIAAGLGGMVGTPHWSEEKIV
jgi:hypothetical protein